jgi:hypothetical protein
MPPVSTLGGTPSRHPRTARVKQEKPAARWSSRPFPFWYALSHGTGIPPATLPCMMGAEVKKTMLKDGDIAVMILLKGQNVVGLETVPAPQEKEFREAQAAKGITALKASLATLTSEEETAIGNWVAAAKGAMEKKYTAEDLYIAFLTCKYFQGPRAGTEAESWKRNVGKGWGAVIEENRAGNRSGVTTAKFERQFNDAKAAVEADRSKVLKG